MNLYHIQWLDHYGRSEMQWGSFPDEEVPKPVTIHSVGYLKYETKDMYTLVPHYFTQEDGSVTGQGEINILKCCVTKKKKLKV